MADLDRRDMAGAPFQQDFAEASGRGADIEAMKAFGRERKMIERMLELEGGTRDIGAGLIGDGDRRVVGYMLCWFRGGLAVHHHGAALEGIRRPRALRIEAARDQRLIEPDARQPGSRGSVPEGVPSALSVIFSMRASASFKSFSQCFLSASPRS